MQYFYSYAHFFASVLFLLLGTLILVRDFRSRLNQTSAAVMLCFFIWSFTFTFIHHPATSLHTAELFEKIGSIGWIWFSLFHFWFVWLYTKKNNPLATIACFAGLIFISSLLSYQQVVNLALITKHNHHSFGWVAVWNNNPWVYLYYIYCFCSVAVALYLFYNHGRKSDNRFVRQQTTVLIVTGIITMVLGSVINIILSLFKNDLVVPIGDVTSLVWAFGLAYVAIRYNMLNITPFIAANKIITTMRDLLFLLDTHGFIISVNSAALQTLRCRNHQLIGRPFGDLIIAPESERTTIIESLLNSEAFTGETTLGTPPGSIIPVALSTSLIPDTGIVCVAHNILLQKQRTEELREAKNLLEKRVFQATAELQTANAQLITEVNDKNRAVLALKESEVRFRAIFENAPDGIYLIDGAGIVVDVNNEALRITGHEKHALVGKLFFTAGRFTSSDSSAADLSSLLLTSMSNPTALHEVQVNRPNGTMLPAEIILHPVTVGGSPMNIGIIRDLSQRKKAEAEAEELKLALHQSMKMDAIGRLAGGIAHDFNNLLGGIIGYAGLSKKRLVSQFPSEAQVMQKIIDVAKQAADRTSQLLAFARRGKYCIEPVNMHALIDEVIGLMEHTIDPRIKLVKQYNAATVIVTGDRSQLYSALLNLGVNARDALPDGGTIIFSSENCVLDADYLANKVENPLPGMFLKLTVSDDGIGMDEATKQRIFEPFFSTKPVGKGTGLGLASVYGTITHHNGFIEIASTPGSGSSFALSLPTAVREALQEKPSTAEALPDTGQGTILVVDDTPHLRDMIVDTLSDLGYRVHACENGASAVRWFHDHHATCNLVLLDYTMPGMNGKECFMALKEIHPTIKAIILSGHALDKDISSSLDDGVLAFLQKPFEIEQLITLVQNNLTVTT